MMRRLLTIISDTVFQPISDLIVIILCHTSHPGNIGAAARAMKNMGLNQLVLVSPKAFPHPEATARASGADDVLMNAKVINTLEEGVADCQWLLGTSARQRAFPWPELSPRLAAEKIQALTTQSQQKVALIFGNEQSGLSNEELQLCDYHVCIPTHSEFASLNLAAALQVLTYEIFQAFHADSSLMKTEKRPNKANTQEILGLIKHFEEIAVKLDFLDPSHPKKLLPRIQKLLIKAQLEKEEVNILRGFFSAIERKKKS